ncbi:MULTISPECIES: histidine phosphatase family protein [Streptomyces]|jgi:broad specificity phosphatase PhoE|uniref:Broad specificity phosphatase PhoE n=1 Tax=Streptomyces radiopugnans TaxID=403935 RepID=A0A1H9IT48_9ACTN|nr:histidine phosphatase family protein [Streptomyces radiopugnans]URN11600.1 histidine phosphatase family protein [Streptomyces radiopugnans]SEQ77760.1 Broad specificity phosphatase PhoE [Streptomyces radiopugnans]
MHLRITLLAAARSSSLLDVRFEDDRPLDAAGWREAERAIPAYAHLAGAELRYCSPTMRCRETGDVLGMRPLAQPALRECDMGRWRGRTFKEVAAREPRAVDAWLADPHATPHGGESLFSFILRVGDWLDTRPGGEGDTLIAAVVEPTVLRAAAVYALKAPPHTYWRVDVRPLSSITLAGWAGDWTLAMDH